MVIIELTHRYVSDRDKLASKSSSPAAVAPLAAGAAGSDNESVHDDAPVPAAKKGGFSSFVGYEDMVVDEDDEEGGLMSAIAKSKKKDKKKKSKSVAVSDNEEEVVKGDEPAQDMAAPRGIVEVGADDWMEEEFGPTKKKGKAGKKNKGGNKAAAADDDDDFDKALAAVTGQVADAKIEETSAPPPTAEPEVEAPAAGDEGDEPKGVMSKKEKERLKKEKEKVSESSSDNPILKDS